MRTLGEAEPLNNEPRLRALVVDDDHMARKLVSQFLEDEGYEVSDFGLPEDVNAQTSSFALIVMDVRFKRYLPDKTETLQFGGIDYVADQIQRGLLDPVRTTIVFISRWGRDREGLQERLAKVQRHYWVDISTGLEFTEFMISLRKKEGDAHGGA